MENHGTGAFLFSALALLRQHRLEDVMHRMGVPAEDLRALRQDAHWLNSERHVVRRTMDSVLYGALDALGLHRFSLPCEYIACWIAMVVSPCNWMVCCAWYHGARAASSLTADPEMLPINEGVTAEALFSYVCEAYGELHDARYRDFRRQLADVVLAADTAEAADGDA